MYKKERIILCGTVVGRVWERVGYCAILNNSIFSVNLVRREVSGVIQILVSTHFR